MTPGAVRPIILLSLLCLACGEDCFTSGCSDEQGNVLVQRHKHGQTMHNENRLKAKSKARAEHSTTVGMLLAQMEDFVATKGKTGIDGDEIAHIHGIKALIDETILPAILDQVEEHRAELAALMKVIEDCEAHSGGVVNGTHETEEKVRTMTQTTRECIVKEDIVKKKYRIACETVNQTRLVIYLPGEEDFPPPTVPAEEMINYLHIMDDFYCGKYEVFEEEITQCEILMENYTITHEECKYLEKELEEMQCKQQTLLQKNCDYFDTCWTDAVKDYNLRKKEILEMQMNEIGEYEGATQIQCLWKAWIYEDLPCTVNETQIRLCHEFPPNYTNITIEFPPPPPPPSCSTASVEIDICSDEWVNINFGDLGISRDIIEDLRESCVPCPNYIWTSEPEVVKHVHVFNAKHVTGTTYIKTAGQSGNCDAFVETDDPNVKSVEFEVPGSMQDRFVISITANATSVALDLEGSVALVKDQEEGVTMYHNGDQMGIHIEAGQATFTKNGEVFYNMALPEDVEAGFCKVDFCGRPATAAHVQFGILGEE